MKPIFSETRQVGIIVRDLEQKIKTYVEKYNIGPWSVYEHDAEQPADFVIDGDLSASSLKLAVCNMGGVHFALIQPVGDHSMFSQILENTGEGVYYVALQSENLEDTLTFCAQRGIPIRETVHWGESATFYFMDTQADLKFMLAVYGSDSDFKWPHPKYIYPKHPMTGRPAFNNVTQIAVICHDVETTMRTYADKYGIGPWLVYDFNQYTVSDLRIREERINYSMRLGFCNIGSVQWEILQPYDDQTVYAEFLNERGEGIHHIALNTDDYYETKAFAEDSGLSVVQSGFWMDFYQYDYLSTQDDLGFVVENCLIDRKFCWPKPIYTYPQHWPQYF